MAKALLHELGRRATLSAVPLYSLFRMSSLLPGRRQLDHIVPRSRTSRSGYVYLVYSPKMDLFKIGYTNDCSSRLSALQWQFDYGAIMVHWFAHYDARHAETFLHQKFKKQRIWREWFKFSQSELCDFQWLSEWLEIGNYRVVFQGRDKYYA